MAEVVVVVGGRGAYSIVSIKRTVGFSTVTVLKNTVRLIETIKYVSPDFGRIEGAAGLHSALVQKLSFCRFYFAKLCNQAHSLSLSRLA